MKLANALVLMLALSLAFDIAYAQDYNEAFGNIMAKINDFFENEEYTAYAKTIDLVFFSLLFTSIYMVGVKYAFKQVSRVERLLAVLLGFMSAFLMVSQGKSIIALLPYIDLLLYTFLFILLWLALKAIKSKFWRFIAALMLTLIAAAFLGGFFESAPGEFSGELAGLMIAKNGKDK